MALLTPAQVAKKYGFSASQIRKLICTNKIKAQKFGTYYLIEDKDLKKITRKRLPNGQRKTDVKTDVKKD